MNELLNERIISAVKLLFRTTFKTDVKAGTPYTIETDLEEGWDISGVISVTGVYSGLIAVRFRKNLSEAMLRTTQINSLNTEQMNRLLSDMIGEFTNVIAGNIFSYEDAGETMLSIPVTIQGPDHIISWSREPSINVIPFSIGNECFVVETEFRKSADEIVL